MDDNGRINFYLLVPSKWLNSVSTIRRLGPKLGSLRPNIGETRQRVFLYFDCNKSFSVVHVYSSETMKLSSKTKKTGVIRVDILSFQVHLIENSREQKDTMKIS